MVVVVSRFLLAALFAFSGGAKVLDRHGTRTAIEGFGVPTLFVGTGLLLLPGTELATATLLVIGRTSWWGGLASLLLLATFSVAIVVNLGHGRTPDCHCFGQFTSSPIGPKVLVRNLLFTVPAVIVVLAA